MFFEKYVKKYTHCVVFGTVSIFFTVIYLILIENLLKNYMVYIILEINIYSIQDRREVYEKR